jgi:hypothetical protein
MSILVVCPGCRKRFQVGDQFAGRTGSCPSCKKPITIPTAEQEVKVHTPELFGTGGRSTTGQLVLKPIARHETRFNLMMAASIVGGSLVLLGIAWVGGRKSVDLFASYPLITAIGLILVSPPIVLGGYQFLYNDELEPYRGNALYLRVAICGCVYAILWGVFGTVGDVARSGELYMWFLIAPPFVISGAVAALASLDLEFGSGCLLYCFYLIVTMLLRAAAGLGWIWTSGPNPLA